MTLVCFAVKEEAEAFRRLVAERAAVSPTSPQPALPQSGRKRGKTEFTDISIVVSGMGRKNAEKAVSAFLAANPTDLVLTCGFAGGLNSDLAPGAVLFVTEHLQLADKLRAAGAQSATFFCVNQVAVTAAEKQQLRATTGADVVEMESAAIQSVCREQGIPCATVRVISDTATEDLPLDFGKLCRPDMSLDFGKLLWAIAKSPGKISGLMRLQKRCQFAAGELAAVLIKVLP